MSVEASGHPVHDSEGDLVTFWWRTPYGTTAITDEAGRNKIISTR